MTPLTASLTLSNQAFNMTTEYRNDATTAPTTDEIMKEAASGRYAAPVHSFNSLIRSRILGKSAVEGWEEENADITKEFQPEDIYPKLLKARAVHRAIMWVINALLVITCCAVLISAHITDNERWFIAAAFAVVIAIASYGLVNWTNNWPETVWEEEFCARMKIFHKQFRPQKWSPDSFRKPYDFSRHVNILLIQTGWGIAFLQESFGESHIGTVGLREKFESLFLAAAGIGAVDPLCKKVYFPHTSEPLDIEDTLRRIRSRSGKCS